MALINLLKNGGFDDASTWNLENGATIGNGALVFTNKPQGGGMWAGQLITLLPNKTYTVTFSAKRTGRMDVWVDYAYTDQNGQTQYIYGPSMLNSITSNYTTQSWTFTTPSQLSFNLVTFWINGGGNAGDVATAWIDNIRIDFNDGKNNALSGGHPSGTNLIVNGGFEQSDTWLATPDAHYFNYQPYQGLRTAWFKSIPGGGEGYLAQFLPLEPGAEYTISFYARIIGQMDMYMSNEYIRPTGSHIQKGSSMASTLSCAFQRQEWKFIVPDDAIGDTLLCLCYHNTAGSVSMGFVDDVVLVKTKDAPIKPTEPKLWGRIKENGGTEIAVRKHSQPTTALGRWKHPAIFQIKGTSGIYTELLWGKTGGDGSLAKITTSDIEEYANMPTDFVGQMCELAKSFHGITGSRGFNYSDSEPWCQSFVNNMAISAGLANASTKMFQGDSEHTASNTKGMMDWLRANAYLSDHDGSHNPVTEPAKGDWLYTLNPGDVGKFTVSHVELIVEINASSPFKVKTVGGNVINADGPKIVRLRDDWIDLQNLDHDRIGYYVAHGHPHWNA